MHRNKSSQHFAALAIVEIDHLDTVFARRPGSAVAALAHHERADPKLANQAAAIPARRKSGHHHQVAVAALSSRAAKGVRLAVNTWIALLNPPVAPAAQHFALTRKQRRADWNAPLGETLPRLFDRYCEHFFVRDHKTKLNQRGVGLAALLTR